MSHKMKKNQNWFFRQFGCFSRVGSHMIKNKLFSGAYYGGGHYTFGTLVTLMPYCPGTHTLSSCAAFRIWGQFYLRWQGSRCFLRVYPGRQWHDETPTSVRHRSCWLLSHVESSPTIHVSIRTGGWVGFFQTGGDLVGTVFVAVVWLIENDLNITFWL